MTFSRKTSNDTNRHFFGAPCIYIIEIKGICSRYGKYAPRSVMYYPPQWEKYIIYSRDFIDVTLDLDKKNLFCSLAD